MWNSEPIWDVDPTRPRIELYLEGCERPIEPCQAYLDIRRRGTQKWLLRYPAVDIHHDQLIFELGDKFFCLDCGRYEALLHIDCQPCQRLELRTGIKPKLRKVDLIDYTSCGHQCETQCGTCGICRPKMKINCCPQCKEPRNKCYCDRYTNEGVIHTGKPSDVCCS